MRLHEGSVPDGQHAHRCLFNCDAFYALRGASAWHHTLTTSDGDVLGDLTYHTSQVTSGWSAPFGGPDFRREYLKPGMIHEALGDVAGGIAIRCKPASYGENEAATLQALIYHGWRVESCDLNYAMSLPASIDAYEAGLSRQGRAGIDRGEEMGLLTHLAVEADDVLWWMGYEVLRANRETKGRKISLTFDYVRAIRDAFPGLVRMLAVEHCATGRIVAAALVYRIGRGRDLVQFHGDDPEAKLPHSPMNLLVRETVQHSISTGASGLDYGTSTESGVPHDGLCQFKRAVGARAEPRFVLVR